ncbi:MAG: hypothetical protein GX632_00670 [Propioniciclava sp.]|nr:hypothetical protein [Propioniciclava sp.]
MTATLTAGPDPAATSAESHPSRYGWLNTPGTTPTPLAEWDNPEALTLALARAGWTLPAGDELRPDPAERIALRPLPAEAWTCPPWCTACADTPALDLRADPATPLRAVLVHAQPLGTIATTAGTWNLTRCRQALLGDPPRHGRTFIALTTPTGTRTPLTGPEAHELARRLRATALDESA